MTPFEYLAVLISIVLGLGITELLAGVRRLAHAHGRVRYHWLPLTWSALVFVTLVQWWWAAFGLRDRTDWNFFSFLLILLVPGLYYLAAALVLPLRVPDGPLDLREHYFRMRRPFFGALAAGALLETLRALVASDLRAFGLDVAAVALLTTMALRPSPRVHAAGTLLAASLLAVFIVLETLRIV